MDDISEMAEKLAANSVVTKALGRYLEMVLTAVYEDEIKPLRKALEGIAANTCCDKCREASLVASAALGQAHKLPGHAETMASLDSLTLRRSR